MLNTSKLSLVSSLLLLSLGQNTWAAPSNDNQANAIDFTGKITYSTQQEYARRDHGVGRINVPKMFRQQSDRLV